MELIECWFTSLYTLRNVWRNFKSVRAKVKRNKSSIRWQSVVLIFLVMLDFHWIPSTQNHRHQMKLVSWKRELFQTICCVFVHDHFPISFKFTAYLESKLTDSFLITDLLRLYLTQIRQETGNRLIEKVFNSPDGKPSKWWTCFSKKRFMEHSLGGFGQWFFLPIAFRAISQNLISPNKRNLLVIKPFVRNWSIKLANNLQFIPIEIAFVFRIEHSTSKNVKVRIEST